MCPARAGALSDAIQPGDRRGHRLRYGGTTRDPPTSRYLTSRRRFGEIDITPNADGFSVSVGLDSNAANVPGGLVQSLGTVVDSSLNNCATSAGFCQGAGTVVDLSGLSANLPDSTRYWIGLSTSGSALWNCAGNGTGTGTGTTGEFYFSVTNGKQTDAQDPYILQVNGVDNTPFNGTPRTRHLYFAR